MTNQEAIRKPPTIQELKVLIVKAMRLEGVDPASIGDDQPLFADGLGLDSVDALELVVALHKEYGIRFQSQDVKPSDFATPTDLLRFLEKQQASAGRSE